MTLIFYIIKICFSIMIRNIFWTIEAVFKEIGAVVLTEDGGNRAK